MGCSENECDGLMDAPGSVIMSSGVGPDYNPETFTVVYPK